MRAASCKVISCVIMPLILLVPLGCEQEPRLATEAKQLGVGLQAFGAGHYDQAVSLARQVMAGSTDPAVLAEAEGLLLAALRWSSGPDAALAEAEKLLTTIRKSRPQSEEIAGLEAFVADLQAERQSFRKEAAVLQKRVARTGATWNGAKAIYKLARLSAVHQGQKRTEALTSDYRQRVIALRDGKETTADVAATAHLYECAGNFDKATELWVKGAKSEPNGAFAATAIEAARRIHSLPEQRADGIAQVRQLKAKHPNTALAAEATLAEAHILWESGQRGAARKAYRGSIHLKPERPSVGRAVDSLLSTYVRPADAGAPDTDLRDADVRGFTREARRIATGCQGKEAAGQAEYQLAALTWREGDRKQAMKMFRAIISGYPAGHATLQARRGLCDILCSLAQESTPKDREAAIAYWKDAVSLEPDPRLLAFTLNDLAHELIIVGRPTEAHPYVDRLLALPTAEIGAWMHSHGRFMKAQVYYHESDFDHALIELRSLLSDPHQASILPALKAFIGQVEERKASGERVPLGH